MLASQLSYLPLLPFLEHHPHPTYVLPDDWLAPTAAPEPSSSTLAAIKPSASSKQRREAPDSTKSSGEGAPVWLNGVAKAIALAPSAWIDIQSVVRRSQAAGVPCNVNGDAGKEIPIRRPPLLHLPQQGARQQETLSAAASDASSDGGASTARPGSSPDEHTSEEPSPPTVLNGRFSAIIIEVPATNYRVLQLVPCASTPSPASAWAMTSRSSSRPPSSPSTSDVSPHDLLARSASTFITSISLSNGDESFDLSPKSELPSQTVSSDTVSPTSELPPRTSSSETASPTGELPIRPAQDGPRPSAPSAVVLSDRAPAKPTPDEEDARRRQRFDMAGMTRDFDWSKTALGPRETWPQSLKTIVSVVLGTHSESCLWWGPDLNLLYNDSYAEMSQKKHPALFGAPAAVGWFEIWDGLKATALSVINDDVSVHKHDDLLFMQRDGDTTTSEVYFTWSWTGVKDESGRNGGMLNRAWETTAKVLAERRLLTLRELAQATFACDSVKSFSNAVVASLSMNHHDLPFMALYIASDTHTKFTSSSRSSQQQLNLVGSIGIPAGHASAPSELFVAVESSASALGSTSGRASGGSVSAPRPFADAFPRKESLASHRSSSSAGGTPGRASFSTSVGGGSSSVGSGITVTAADGAVCPWPVELALSSGQPILVEDCADLTSGFESRSWGDPISTALVIPVEAEESSHARCLVLIVGLNTRRPLDSDYHAWLSLIRLSLSSGLSGVASLEAQKERAEELARLDRAKTTFFSNVSHELRTPLTLISGPVKDLLATYTSDTPERRLLAITERNVARLSRLVDMLMDVSRVEAGRMQGTFSPRQLGQLTVDLASLFRSAIEKAGLELIIECDVDDPRPVYVDPDLWEKICFNLIGNAFKYTLQGWVKIFVRYGSKDVEFGVEDTGVGIPAEDVPRVVERFHRVSSTGRSFEGTGVGLSLTDELIRVHGGHLLVTSRTEEESTDGSHGSAFVVRLPLGSAHLPADRIDESSSIATVGFSRAVHGFVEEAKTWSADTAQLDAQSTHGETSSHSGFLSESGKSGTSGSGDSSSKIDPSTLFWSKDDTILIVDDNSDIRQYLISTLTPYCRILEARNGQEAYEIALKKMPNLIISDVMMPVLDGFGLIRALKASQTEAALIPVIIITARAGEDEKVGGLLDGADDYLPKPFSSKELIARSHLQMQVGKQRIDLERRFAARTLELHVRAVEAEEKRREAEEQRRQQELLVDVTSHELRNPVSAILNNSKLVGDNLRFMCSELQVAIKDPAGFHPTKSLLSMLEEDIEAMEAIFMMAQSQERIANDVLSLARIQLSTLEIFPVPLDLMSETKRICSVFASECRLKRIHLSLTHGPSLQSLHGMGFKRIQADSGRLAQILINLLSNAIRFTSPAPVREINVSIEVRKDAPDDDTCLPPPSTPRSLPFANDAVEEEIYIYGAVADSGPGLTQEELSRLFQRFRQGSAQTHVVFGGSGLGLYVCRKLLELMDGKIEVVSPGKTGSTFRFFFRASLAPARAPDTLSPGAVPDIMSPMSEAGRAVKALSPTLPSVSGMRVLIVEDNVINQKVLDRQLRKAGITADIASDGAEAIERIIHKATLGAPYSCVLLDINMPVMDGLTAIRKIRELEAEGDVLRTRTPVFALTGNARQGQIDGALEAGMDDVILKPYKIDQVLDKLRSVLRLNR